MKARLLFIDDDRLVLATLGRGLRQAGYTVETAESGKVALDLAASATFDLAIVDIRMPQMSGFEVAKYLQEKHGLSTLFLSAYSDQKLVEEAVQDAGGIGYIVKPVDIPQLIPAVETALSRSRDIRALLAHKGQLEHALNGDRRINAAVGILMERHKLDQQAAFEFLRKKARDERRSLAEFAAQLVMAAESLNN